MRYWSSFCRSAPPSCPFERRGRLPARHRARWRAGGCASRRSGSLGWSEKRRSKTELGVDLASAAAWSAIPPGERVLIDAGIAAVAVAGAAESLDAQLQRGEAGLVADAAGRRSGRPRRRRGSSRRRSCGPGAGEERGRGAGVVAGAVAVGPGLVAGQAGEHHHVVADAAPAAAGSAGSSKSRPSLAGVQSSMCTPLGT